MAGAPSGGTPSNTGGAPGSAGGSASGGEVASGGDPGNGSCAETLTVGPQGYVTSLGEGSTCWNGYSYVGTTGVVNDLTPTDFDSCETSCSLCASGSLDADDTYQAAVYFGFAVAQERGDATPEGFQAPLASPLTVSYTNPGGSELRIELVGSSQRWCRTVSPSSSSGTLTLPFSSFQTECWDTLGDPYDGEPLRAVQLVVPSRAVATPFSACLVDFH
jgi:hypothetical protein